MKKLIVNPYFQWLLISIFGYFAFGFYLDTMFGIPRFSLLFIWGFSYAYVSPKYLSWLKNTFTNYLLITVFEAFAVLLGLIGFTWIIYKTFQPAPKVAFAVFFLWIIYKIILRFIKEETNKGSNDL
jgi:hypothetical protein